MTMRNSALSGDTIEVSLGITYNRCDILEYNWNASFGEVIGSGQNIQWIAPDSSASYILQASISDGNYSTSGRISILTRNDEEIPIYNYSGSIKNEYGHNISPVFVMEDIHNYNESMPSGLYSISSLNMPIDLTFIKQNYEALILDGISLAPDVTLRCREPENIYYSVLIHAWSYMFYPYREQLCGKLDVPLVKGPKFLAGSLTPVNLLMNTYSSTAFQKVIGNSLQEPMITAINTQDLVLQLLSIAIYCQKMKLSILI
ncbi:MAG: hypothetical protein ACLFSQ_08060 [Candidatus Zixiibacteriota bacterium]